MASRYLNFEQVITNNKTLTYNVKNNVTNTLLGSISWHNHWRKYVFFPVGNMLFDASCLSEVISKMEALMLERKIKKQNDTTQSL